VIISNIPAHRELGLEKESYFSPGNIYDLRIKIEDKLKAPFSGKERGRLLSLYNWDTIAKKTEEVYTGLLFPPEE
jgi:hypothetical protein